MAKFKAPDFNRRTPAWQWNEAEFIIGLRELQKVDELTIEMEKRWGEGLLRLKLDSKLRERFDNQRYKLNAAINGGDLDHLREQCRRMINALRAADAVASALGDPMPAVWEIGLPDGRLVGFVQSSEGILRAQRSGRYASVWSAEEVARIIDAMPHIVGAVKERFGGSEVNPLKALECATPIGQLPTFDAEVGDEIPF